MTKTFNGEHYLITTDDWFYAPDGQSYKAVWGKAQISSDEEVLGFKGRASAANWFLTVTGDKTNCPLIVAGCQVHYAVICNDEPIGSHVYKP